MYKVLVIGNVRVGKTSFVNQFVQNKFVDNYKCTLGVDFALKTLEVEKGQYVKLQLWDIAGTERVTSMMRIYYKGASSCILIFDVTDRESFLDCIKWKQDLDDKVRLADRKPVPCILVGNKIDIEQQRVVSDQEIKRFARENNFVSWKLISVKLNKGVESSVRTLTKNMLDRCNNMTYPMESEYEATTINELDLTVQKKLFTKICCPT